MSQATRFSAPRESQGALKPLGGLLYERITIRGPQLRPSYDAQTRCHPLGRQSYVDTLWIKFCSQIMNNLYQSTFLFHFFMTKLLYALTKSVSQILTIFKYMEIMHVVLTIIFITCSSLSIKYLCYFQRKEIHDRADYFYLHVDLTKRTFFMFHQK